MLRWNKTINKHHTNVSNKQSEVYIKSNRPIYETSKRMCSTILTLPILTFKVCAELTFNHLYLLTHTCSPMQWCKYVCE